MKNGKSEKNGRDMTAIHWDMKPAFKAQIAKDARRRRLSVTAYLEQVVVDASPVGPDHFPDRKTGISQFDESQMELMEERRFLQVLEAIIDRRVWRNIKHMLKHTEHGLFTWEQILQIRNQTASFWDENKEPYPC